MRISTLFLLTLLPVSALAAPPAPQDKYLSRCEATPTVKPVEHYPGRAVIVPSNKPALPAGKPAYANGQVVYLSGRVLDSNCVPVSDAIVDIWQGDSNGKYARSTMSGRLSPDPYFTGSGRAVTDNLGRYNFVTVFPGSKNDRAPHLHVHVIHPRFPTLDTEMFFSDDQRNDTDPKLKKLPADQHGLVTAKAWPVSESDPKKGLAAQWDITLKGKNAWRHF